MKKLNLLFMIMAVALVSGLTTFHLRNEEVPNLGQENIPWLRPGAVMGWHVIEAKPGVSQEEFEAFVKEKYIPGWSEAIPGSRVFLLEGERGENPGQLVFLWVFEDLETRNSYWPEPEVSTDLYKEHREKLEYLYTGDEAWRNIGTFKPATDYIVIM